MLNMMRTPTAWRTLAYPAALIALLAGCGRGDPQASIAAESTSTQTPRTIDQTAQETYQPFAERFRPPDVLCGEDRVCLDSPLVAATPEELLWLRANGYPSVRELRALRALPEHALRTSAASGSRAAMVVLGARLVGERHEREGLDMLTRAANAGSIYAYYELSNSFARSPSLANRLESAAFLRVAYLLGDAKASNELHKRFSALGPVESVIVDERAASLYRTFAKSRQPHPRPMGAR